VRYGLIGAVYIKPPTHDWRRTLKSELPFDTGMLYVMGVGVATRKGASPPDRGGEGVTEGDHARKHDRPPRTYVLQQLQAAEHQVRCGNHTATVSEQASHAGMWARVEAQTKRLRTMS
jgi:hypothetical protein